MMRVSSWVCVLLLTGCPYIGERGYDENVRDVDGDGAISDRFGGPDCADDNPDITDCDADDDGFQAVAVGGADCDDADAGVHPDADEVCDGRDNDCDLAVDDGDDDLTGAPTWYRDDDRDGFGAPDASRLACTAPDNHVADNRDCDDGRDDIRPGATEFCDALDRNCDGDPFADAVDPSDWWRDDDGDGFGAEGTAVVAFACVGPPATAPNDADCDDSSATAYPTAEEIWYDGIDQDCLGGNDYDADGDGDPLAEGGGADCDDGNALISTLQTEVCNDGVDNDCDLQIDEADGIGGLLYYVDADGDTFGDDLTGALFCPGSVPADRVLVGGDCDDSLASVSPVGTEICDNLDNNCNGSVDDNAVGMATYYQDSDGDGFGSTALQACALGPGMANNGDDCNDADPASYPGALEVCGDSVRQDCSTLSAFDCDGDGFEDVANGGDDCDDTRDDVNPAAPEVCDGFDNDCDLMFDSADPSVDLSTRTNWYVDDDFDGFGTNQISQLNACDPLPGEANNTDDCDDGRSDVYPGAPELCDTIDNDCDTFADDDDPDDVVVDVPTWHLDSDGDTFGDPLIAYTQTCAPPETGTWVAEGTDCNDGVAETNPFAVEVCDGVDNDCDLFVDDDDPDADLTPWYRDGDGDSWGVSTDVLAQCTQPSGYVGTPGDCNDFAASTNPGAEEVCDAGADNDCDGLSDDQDPDLNTSSTWYADDDGDGYGTPDTSVAQCAQPTGFVGNSGDCDDTRATVSPASLEVCDGLDNDCDLNADDLDDDVVNAPIWYEDGDFDGFGSNIVSVAQCLGPIGWLPQSGDCDDADSDRNPAADEICDTVDNDCDTLVDQLDPSVVATTWYRDADHDSYGDDSDTIDQCTSPGATHVTVGGDCDDGDSAFSPLATEVCDGRDNDCDGLVDDADLDLVLALDDLWFDDIDNDGYGDINTGTLSCSGAAGQVNNFDDCRDDLPGVHPGALELCDDIDNDCDLLVDGDDPGVVNTENVWFDTDMDGFGDEVAGPFQACSHNLDPGFVTQGGDCVDTDNQIHQGRGESCLTAYDDNCNGEVNEMDDSLEDGFPYFRDADNDGAGDPSIVEQRCAAELGWVPFPTDCNDNLPTVFPGADEICDGIDNDCDFAIDDADPQGVVGATTWFSDDDGDGVGAAVFTQMACDAPGGMVSSFDDCEPFNPAVFPGNPERCNTIDDDCDFMIDDADPQGPVDPDAWYSDVDLDGYGEGVPVFFCEPPSAAWSTDDGDCQPEDPMVNPGAREVCDNGTTDEDCDGLIDDSDPSVDGDSFYNDVDLDGWGDVSAVTLACTAPPMTSTKPGDCDDSNSTLYPGQSIVVSPFGGFNTVGSAINAACEDAEILVAPGFYPEALLLEEPIVLRGLDPSNPPVIEGPFTQSITVIGQGVFVESVELTVNGFVAPVADVQFGTATFTDVTFHGGDNAANNGGGLGAFFADVTCVDCRFEENTALFGAGLYAQDSTVTVLDSTFAGNVATFGGGIYMVNTTAVIGTTRLEDNLGSLDGSAIMAVSSTAQMSSLDIRDHIDGGPTVMLINTSGELVGSDLVSNRDMVVDDQGTGSVFDVRDTRYVASGQGAGTEASLTLEGATLNSLLENVSVLASSNMGIRIDEAFTVIRNVSVIGSTSHGVQVFNTTSGDYSNFLLYDNGTPELDLIGATALVDFGWFTNAAESALFAGSDFGNPSLQTYHPNLDPTLWDIHPKIGPVDAGNPGIQDADGGASDIGATGGPNGDAFWYHDDDGDGMWDGWEVHHFGTTAPGPLEDPDGDGVDNDIEMAFGTYPADNDTDGDGSQDGVPDLDDLDPLL